MKFLKSHFALSRSQQNGIFVLIALIIVFQIVLFTVDFYQENEPDSKVENQIEAYRKQLDSLNKNVAKTKDTIYPFNPNYISDFKGYQLGMNVAEIDRLLSYRKEGKWINSEDDFKKVTGVSDSLLKKISPSFRFPEWTQNRTAVRTQPKSVSKIEVGISDLNSVNAEDLTIINGVGDVLSKRIVKYRNSIGGFRDPIQLNDVYGLSPEVIARIQQRFHILSRPDITIKDINTISIAELAEIPYFNFEQAKDIINYRKLHERISSFDELSKIDSFPYDKIDRIKLYLAVM